MYSICIYFMPYIWTIIIFLKGLPQLHSLIFWEARDSGKVPKCTFTGMQYLIQFCPKLENLTLCVDAHQIPILATQPYREYLSGLHLITLNLCHSHIWSADDVVPYLTMLFPALEHFSTAYSDHVEDDKEEIFDCERQWMEVEQQLNYPNWFACHEGLWSWMNLVTSPVCLYDHKEWRFSIKQLQYFSYLHPRFVLQRHKYFQIDWITTLCLSTHSWEDSDWVF